MMVLRRKIALAFLLCSNPMLCAAPTFGEQVCQILNASRSRITLEAALGDGVVQGRLTRFAGVLLLDPQKVPASKVKIAAEPASLELDGSPQLNVLLQNLLNGVEREKVTFVSEQITARGGGNYEVSGIAVQGGRRENVAVHVAVKELTSTQTRLTGSLRRGRSSEGALAGAVDFEAVFNAQPMTACFAK